MFSTRVPANLPPNRLTRAVSAARRDGRELIDLTLTNPTAAGLGYPASLLQPLAMPEALTYAPEPFGLPAARRAVADDYARRGTAADADRIVLTASTSEAYALLFKLLCDPGDSVLVPVPSYPLFDHLTRLDAVRPIPYCLEYHGRWVLDESTLRAQVTEDVRAVLAVSPNNPTGSVLTEEELRRLDECCAEREAALILDEVFADYPLQQPATRRSVPAEALTFRLGGLSKSAGLPQVKLGWILVDGPEPLVRAALERLELICDTYLSVSTPVQVAARQLMAAGAVVRAQILERIRTNHRELQRQASARPEIEVLEAEAGWCAVVRVPSTVSEEDLVVRLVEQDGVIAHPGFFFDFPHEAFVIVSLLPETNLFSTGVGRLLERARA